jgi:hypothetical protein
VLNVDAVRDWVKRVREFAVIQDRAEITDLQIGAALAHLPDDDVDEAWPHRIVRDILEMYSSPTIDRGLWVEKVNMRGVYSKNPFEGGGQERALAAQAREWLSKASAWPRTANVLISLAASWDRDAKREDERAQTDQI